MSAVLHHEGANVYRLDIDGTLAKDDFDRLQDDLVVEMAHAGSVRLLIVLDGFDGWAPTDNWRDLSFYVTYGDSIERIAIVGEERWRSLSLMFASADLRKAPVEFFPADAVAAARAWLA